MNNRRIINILRNYFVKLGWEKLKAHNRDYFRDNTEFIEIYVFFCMYPNKINGKQLSWNQAGGDSFTSYTRYFLEHVNIALLPYKKEIGSQTITFNFKNNTYQKRLVFHPFCDINQI